jgi:hypothetical protein
MLRSHRVISRLSIPASPAVDPGAPDSGDLIFRLLLGCSAHYRRRHPTQDLPRHAEQVIQPLSIVGRMV